MNPVYSALKTALFMEGQSAIEDFIGYDLPDESKDVTERRMDMAYEQMPSEEFNLFLAKYLPNTCVCKECGAVLNSEEDIPHVINPGLDGEYTLCNTCHDAKWDANDIIMCEGCGNWFDNNRIKSYGPEIADFAPCPICGKDVVEGTTEAEARYSMLSLMQSMAETDMSCHGHLTARTSEALNHADCWWNPDTKLVEDNTRKSWKDYGDPATIFLNELIQKAKSEVAPFDVAINDNGIKLFSFVPIHEGNAKLIYLRKQYVNNTRIDILGLTLIGIVAQDKFWVFDTLPHFAEIFSWLKWDAYLKEHPALIARFQLEYQRIFREAKAALAATYEGLDVHGYLSKEEQQKIIDMARNWQFSVGDSKQDVWNDMTVPDLGEPSLDGIIKVFCGTYSQEAFTSAFIQAQMEKMKDFKARANHFLHVIQKKAHAEEWEITLADAFSMAPHAFSVTATFELDGKTASAEIRPCVILSKIRLKQFYTKNDFCQWKAANQLFRELNAVPVNLKSENIVKITHSTGKYSRVIYQR